MGYDRLIKVFLLCCLLAGSIGPAFSSDEQPVEEQPSEDQPVASVIEGAAPPLETGMEGPEDISTESASEQIEAPSSYTPTFESMYEAKARAKRSQKSAKDDGPGA